jgi:hypothetical protein
MPTNNLVTATFRIAAVGSLFLLAIGAHGAETNAGKSTPARATSSVPDACSFIPKAELERLIGRELRDGKPKDMPPGLYQCDFTTPPKMYVKRQFNNPPLPEAAGFSSVVITTNPTTPSTFAESRRVMQANAEDVTGVGDAAFFNGPAMIYVRVGNRGFSIRLHVNAPTTDAGRARLKDVMLSLARAGVARLL